jgi:flagellar secretion chaperone FliS
MSFSGRDHYLEQEILSASPQKLQLLLIEGAIRQANKAQLFWLQSQDSQARQAIVRAQEIVAQMLAGLQSDRSQILVRRVAAVYSFIIKSLAKAYLQHDERALAEALQILEIERETWRQVCQQFNNQKSSGRTAAPHFSHLPNAVRHEISGGLSLEA